MATMVAVDLGAQSGRVALAGSTASGSSVAEVHRFANEPVRLDGDAPLGRARAVPRASSTGCAAAGARRAASTRSASTPGASTSASLDRRGRLVAQPGALPRRAPLRRVEPALARIPPRELYERTGIQLMPINTVFELAAMAAERDPALDDAETLLMIPDLFHYWLARHARRRAHERDDDAVPRRAHGRVGRRPARAPRRPAGLLPELVEPGTPLGPLAATRRGDGLGARGRRGRHARHGVGGRGRAVPPARLGVRQRRHVVARRRRARRAADHRRDVRREPHERRRRRRHLPPAPERHRALAPRTSAAGAGRRGARRSLRRARRAGARRAAPLRSLIDPDDPSFAAARRHAASASPTFCAAHGPAAARGPRAVARCILESLALKHAEVVDLLARVTGRDAAGAPRRRRRRPQRAALPLDRRRRRPARARRPRGGDAASGTCSSRRSRSASSARSHEAREVVERLVRAGGVRARAVGRLGRGARRGSPSSSPPTRR